MELGKIFVEFEIMWENMYFIKVTLDAMWEMVWAVGMVELEVTAKAVC